MSTVKRIETRQIKQFQRKRVAAYARVSVDTEQLMHSLSAQVSYYSNLIQGTPEWEYVGVYIDAGITGTDTKPRERFQEMIADCEAGKIDIILTKSISRFARNTVDLLATVRHLKELGVEVRFEREHVNTFTSDGEVMLSILASFAEQESISLSQNIKWRVRKNYEQGKPHAHLKLYGYRWEGDERIIEPDEAEVVRFIFAEYLSGKSFREIATELDEKEIRSKAFFSADSPKNDQQRRIHRVPDLPAGLCIQASQAEDQLRGASKVPCGRSSRGNHRSGHLCRRSGNAEGTRQGSAS